MRNEYRAYLQQCKEQESLYHQIALSLGLPDSVLYLLYTIAEQGDRKNPGRLYSEWSISKQTGHSAVEWPPAGDKSRGSAGSGWPGAAAPTGGWRRRGGRESPAP